MKIPTNFFIFHDCPCNVPFFGSIYLFQVKTFGGGNEENEFSSRDNMCCKLGEVEGGCGNKLPLSELVAQIGLLEVPDTAQ